MVVMENMGEFYSHVNRLIEILKNSDEKEQAAKLQEALFISNVTLEVLVKVRAEVKNLEKSKIYSQLKCEIKPIMKFINIYW